MTITTQAILGALEASQLNLDNLENTSDAQIQASWQSLLLVLRDYGNDLINGKTSEQSNTLTLNATQQLNLWLFIYGWYSDILAWAKLTPPADNADGEEQRQYEDRVYTRQQHIVSRQLLVNEDNALAISKAITALLSQLDGVSQNTVLPRISTKQDQDSGDILRLYQNLHTASKNMRFDNESWNEKKGWALGFGMALGCLFTIFSQYIALFNAKFPQWLQNSKTVAYSLAGSMGLISMSSNMHMVSNDIPHLAMKKNWLSQVDDNNMPIKLHPQAILLSRFINRGTHITQFSVSLFTLIATAELFASWGLIGFSSLGLSALTIGMTAPLLLFVFAGTYFAFLKLTQSCLAKAFSNTRFRDPIEQNNRILGYLINLGRAIYDAFSQQKTVWRNCFNTAQLNNNQLKTAKKYLPFVAAALLLCIFGGYLSGVIFLGFVANMQISLALAFILAPASFIGEFPLTNDIWFNQTRRLCLWLATTTAKQKALTVTNFLWQAPCMLLAFALVFSYKVLSLTAKACHYLSCKIGNRIDHSSGYLFSTTAKKISAISWLQQLWQFCCKLATECQKIFNAFSFGVQNAPSLLAQNLPTWLAYLFSSFTSGYSYGVNSQGDDREAEKERNTKVQYAAASQDISNVDESTALATVGLSGSEIPTQDIEQWRIYGSNANYAPAEDDAAPAEDTTNIALMETNHCRLHKTDGSHKLSANTTFAEIAKLLPRVA